MAKIYRSSTNCHTLLKRVITKNWTKCALGISHSKIPCTSSYLGIFNTPKKKNERNFKLPVFNYSLADFKCYNQLFSLFTMHFLFF